ncbi:hypothetical protein GCM10010472_29110 [Pseudonocardia halophobica]|uniref:Dentin sialophosphoprotein n=1 Tax=Pseudonocardia halophobica TaxID=29401 RepID=A0A9W6KZ88_9PSEU|nr:IniB N-terminal domain-containing protein [Pseudonocardia halophobica]GLL09170.1 hypothetical protein GCM10017577_03100 [Pseudonocardia halophobica]
MASPQTLIELLLSLLNDPEAAEAFKADPAAYIEGCGLTEFTAEDVHDAALLIQDNDDSDFDRKYDTGGNHHHTPPPPPHKEPHESDHEHAVKYLNTYVTNNWIDDRDTIVDNSINQDIDTGGGDFDQEIDIDAVTASGDGAVAAGGDIEDSTITTGNGNVVGDGNNVVDGDDNTTAFGSGDANSASFEDVSVDDGGALSVGGTASGNYDVDNSGNEYSTETNNSTSIDDSYNQDNDFESSVSDEDTTISNTDVDTETNIGSGNDVTVDA